MTKKGHVAARLLFRAKPGAEDGTAEIVRLQCEVNRLSRAVEELAILNDLAVEIGASTDYETIIGRIIKRSMRAVQAEQASITLVDRADMNKGKTLLRIKRSSSSHPAFRLDQALLGWIFLNKAPLVLNDVKTDPRLGELSEVAGLRSLLCVPLMLFADVIGVLAVFNKSDSNQFSQDDQRLLAIIAAQSAQVIENARLYEEESALRRIQEDLHAASRIQMSMLPKDEPPIPGYEIAGASLAAQEVGGDFYDFRMTDDRRLAFYLGDVSGKGLPAALLMANVQATLRAQIRYDSAPSACLQRANSLLYSSTDSERYASLFFAALDLANHQIRYGIAGQAPPLGFYQDGAPLQALSVGGVVLGAFEHVSYEEHVFTLSPGGFLVVFSDGVTDATNARGERYGKLRLTDILSSSAGSRAIEIVAEITRAISDFHEGASRTDDVTVLVLKRNCA